MGKKAEMERLGAKLTNLRWSWDGVRADGSIVFIGWDDEVVRTPGGEIESFLIFKGDSPAINNPGGRERFRHIAELEKSGSVGYLKVAFAGDVHASPRQIIGFDENLYSVQIERRGSDVFAIPVGLNSAPTAADGEEDDFDCSNSDISETEKQQLIQARQGQGLFRARVELLEAGCRVTGVNDRAHLRAGHIKPWRDSTNEERLDGNNGLLLAPHVDHLFDRGFISFGDDGRMLISPRLSSDVLEAWGIAPKTSCGTFNQRQSVYLAFHREKFGFEKSSPLQLEACRAAIR